MKKIFFNLFFISLFVILVGCVGAVSENRAVLKNGEAGNLKIEGVGIVGPFPIGDMAHITVRLTNLGRLAVSLEKVELEMKAVVSFAGGNFPGFGGTCEIKKLETNESCTIVFQVFSSTPRVFNEKISIAYVNGIEPLIFTGHFSGMAGVPANIVVKNNLKTINFGIVEPGVSKSEIFEVENEGDLPAVDIQGFFANEGDADQVFFFSGPSRKYPGLNGTCGKRIEAKEVCKIEVQVIPITAGTQISSDVKIAYNNPLSLQTTTLNLDVVAAEIKAYLSVEEASQAVGEVLNGAVESERKSLTWTIKNDGLIKATNIQLFNPKSIPLEFADTTCLASGLLPGESCTMTYKFNPNYPIPLPSPLAFPIILRDHLFSFSYDDGKYPAPAKTNELEITGKILDEAYLVIYENSDTSKPFSLNQNLSNITSTWDKNQWIGNIGASSNPIHNLKIANVGIGARIDAKDIQIEILNNDGDLTTYCTGSGQINCTQKISAGSSEILNLEFRPKYRIPFFEDHEYKIKLTYNTGIRIKTYEIIIPTERKAKPIISFSEGADGAGLDKNINVNLANVLPRMTTSQMVTFKNTGPLPYHLDFIYQNPSQLSLFSIPDSTNECLTKDIANGETCSLTVIFSKSDYANDGLELSDLTILFSNGLDPVSASYESYSIKFIAKLSSYGKYTQPVTAVNFGSLPWSNTPALERSAILAVAAVKAGDWGISHYEYELVGAGKDNFSVGYETIAPTKKPGEFYYDAAPSFKVTYKSPVYTGVPLLNLNAQLKVRYYGQNPDEFTGYLPGDEIVFDLAATTQNDSYYESQSLAYIFGPMPIGESEVQDIFIVNNGQIQASSPVSLTLITSLGSTFSKLSDFTALSSNCEGFVAESAILFKFNVAPNQACKIQFRFTATAAGTNSIAGSLRFKSLDNKERETTFLMSGRSNAFAYLNIDPAVDRGTYTSFGEYKIGNGIEKEFTLTNISGEFGSDGEVQSVSLVAPASSGCAAITAVQPEWKDYNKSDGQNVDYKITENTCNGKTLLHEEDTENTNPSKVLNCKVKISFYPEKIDSLIGACLKVTYRRYIGDPTVNGVTTRQFLGYGVPPSAFFNGWRGIFAEGETENSTYKVKLQWNPMSIEAGLGNIVGYNIYKKKSKDATFVSKPLNSVRVTTLQAGNYFEFIETADTVPEEYPEALSGDLYDYYIKPIVKFNGIATEYIMNAQENDRFAKVIIPSPYTVLLNRRNVNTLVCMDFLGKSYADLARGGHNSCAFTGYGSNGGIFDIGKDLIVDRYENIELNNTPTNAPGYLPKLYGKLSDAQDSCSAQKMSVEGVNIFDKRKRLIKRMEYMIAGLGQQASNCNIEASGLAETGKGTCLSKFGIEDLVGNAWDFVDATMTRGTTANELWTLGDNFGVGAGRKWPVELRLLNFDGEVSFADLSTFTSKRAHNASWSPCFNRLFGLPMKDMAGECNQGAEKISVLLPTMGLNSSFNYVYTLENTSNMLDIYEGKRNLFAGGSYESRERFGIDSSIYSMYWNFEAIETIMHAYQSKPWEGGAARCVLEVAY